MPKYKPEDFGLSEDHDPYSLLDGSNPGDVQAVLKICRHAARSKMRGFSEVDVDDAVQIAYVRIMDGIRGGHFPEENATSYYYSTARNTTITYMMGELTRWRGLTWPDEVLANHANGSQPWEEAADMDGLERLQKGLSVVIDRLARDHPGHDEILRLAVHGCTYVEMARICDIPVGTVTSRLFRARDYIREYLVEFQILDTNKKLC